MTRDRRLLELACKEVLMNIVKESKTISEKLTFFQKTLMYDMIREMEYNEVLSLLINKGEKITSEQKREFESKTKKTAKYSAAAMGGGIAAKRLKTLAAKAKIKAIDKKVGKGKLDYQVGKDLKSKLVKGKLKSFRLQKGGTRAGWKGAIGAVAALYLFRKLTDPCVRNNLGNKKAQLACRMEAIKKVVSVIKADMGKCAAAANPAKCKQKLGKELIKWRTKYQKLLIQYNQIARKKNK